MAVLKQSGYQMTSGPKNTMPPGQRGNVEHDETAALAVVTKERDEMLAALQKVLQHYGSNFEPKLIQKIRAKYGQLIAEDELDAVIEERIDTKLNRKS